MIFLIKKASPKKNKFGSDKNYHSDYNASSSGRHHFILIETLTWIDKVSVVIRVIRNEMYRASGIFAEVQFKFF